MDRLEDNITKYGTFWQFKMTKHYHPCSDKVAMHEIADFIQKFNLPIDENSGELAWFLDHLKEIFNLRFSPVLPAGISKRLWMILDNHSKSKKMNWLIWWVYESQRKRVITHFGPFGDAETKKMKKLRDKFFKTFRNSGVTAVQFLRVLKEAYENKNVYFLNLLKEWQRKLAALIKEIGELKASRIAQKVGKDLAWFVAGALCKELAEIAIKTVGKEALEIAAKQGAKEVAKQGAKQGGKAAAKAVPFVGLAVGAGFGIWRLCQGKPELAALEVASGAASCMPGAGTVASLGIDAGIAALDICSGVDEEKEKELINIMKQIEECKRNMDSLDKAFDFLKSVLESAIYRSGEDNAITRMNLEDFTNRYLNSCLEIL